jgi:hypothetical protein
MSWSKVPIFIILWNSVTEIWCVALVQIKELCDSIIILLTCQLLVF